jgi:alkanesulfonate monooxygenase SsuD/methylene tetrahydromethanopterin reductase-like flavin-dependent oxidoreductase (luciferase family)
MGIVARYADEWNKSGGSPEVVAPSLNILQQRCAEVGRDFASIRKSVMVWMHIRERADDAMDVHGAIRVAAGFPPESDRGALAVPTTAGTIEQVADAVRAYEGIGVDELLLQMHEPYDLETLERLSELRAHLAR